MTARGLFVKLSLWALGLGLVSCGAWFGRRVPFAEQWPMFEALRTTASIIFAVIGAWLAIIYPDRLKLSFKSQPDMVTGSRTGVGKLFTPVVHSTSILCVILVIGVLAPILKRVDVLALGITLDWVRGGSYGVLIALTLWQLWTVLLTLIPADTVKSFVDHEDRHAATVAGYRGDRSQRK